VYHVADFRFAGGFLSYLRGSHGLLSLLHPKTFHNLVTFAQKYPLFAAAGSFAYFSCVSSRAGGRENAAEIDRRITLPFQQRGDSSFDKCSFRQERNDHLLRSIFHRRRRAICRKRIGTLKSPRVPSETKDHVQRCRFIVSPSFLSSSRRRHFLSAIGLMTSFFAQSVLLSQQLLHYFRSSLVNR